MPGAVGRFAIRLLASSMSGIDQGARPLEYGTEHGRRESPGLGVVAAAVIRIEQVSILRQAVVRAVPEPVRQNLEAERLQDGGVRDDPERQHYRPARERLELALEINVARCNLGGQRLVVRRQTLDRVRDAAALESQPVVGGDGFGALGKAEAVKRLIQQNAGVVSGERPPGAVGAVQPRCEPHDEQARVFVPKGGYGPRMVLRMI